MSIKDGEAPKLDADDWKWVDQIRKELFYRLDMQKKNPGSANANSRIVALDKLIEIAKERDGAPWGIS